VRARLVLGFFFGVGGLLIGFGFNDFDGLRICNIVGVDAASTTVMYALADGPRNFSTHTRALKLQVYRATCRCCLGLGF
jgi:hypothetical protein